MSKLSLKSLEKQQKVETDCWRGFLNRTKGFMENCEDPFCRILTIVNCLWNDFCKYGNNVKSALFCFPVIIENDKRSSHPGEGGTVPSKFLSIPKFNVQRYIGLSIHRTKETFKHSIINLAIHCCSRRMCSFVFNETLRVSCPLQMQVFHFAQTL